MMPIGQFGVDGCHLDGGRAQCGLGDHQGGRQGGGTGAVRNIGAGVLVSCDYVGGNICMYKYVSFDPPDQSSVSRDNCV